MYKSNLPSVKWNIIFIIIACLVVGIDQISKIWIRSHFFEGQSIPETGFFRLTFVQNTGAAFSIFNGRADILGIVSIFGALLILFYSFVFARRMPFPETRLNKTALGLMLGGTIGNMIDRLAFGRVTDFFDVGPWPVFNIADSCMVVGVILFAFELILFSRKGDKETRRGSE
jgi:signal peptidase II